VRLGRVYHVTSTENRESVREHGLDWRRMNVAPGLASDEFTPEQEAVFVCATLPEAEWFARFAKGRFAVDVWSIEATGLPLHESEDGFLFVDQAIPPDRLELVTTIDS
jgi:hypothetical protein